MVTAVPSRFAVLSIDDDECKPRKPQKSINVKNKTNPKDGKRKQTQKKKDKKKQNEGKQKNNCADRQQWEQWKEKDSMVVEGTYEQELHEAILLSKLSYQEAQMEVKPNIENNEEINKKSNKKSKKSVMSLKDFNDLNYSVIQSEELKPEKNNDFLKAETDTEFFQKVEKEASVVLTKEKENDTLKERFNQQSDEVTFAHLKAEIEERDNIIEKLKFEVEKLKEDLSNVRNRNKRLYQILQYGEMKDKAAILAEVIRLQEIQDELTSAVTLLHEQLEQERTKTRASVTDIKGTKNNKKRIASDNISNTSSNVNSK